MRITLPNLYTFSAPYETDLSRGLTEETLKNLYLNDIKDFMYGDFYSHLPLDSFKLHCVIKPLGMGREQRNYFILKENSPVFFAKLDYHKNSNTLKSIFAWRKENFYKGILSLLYSSLLSKHNLESSNIVSPYGKFFWSKFSLGKIFVYVDRYHKEHEKSIEECFSTQNKDLMHSFLRFYRDDNL